MPGLVLSILLPLITGVVQLPDISQTIRTLVHALAFSSPAATEVTSENDASPEFASPLSLSLAVQASLTLSACQAPSGDAHVMVGAIVSIGGLLPLMPASIHA